MKIPESYEIVKQERVEEIGADAFFLHHRKSGAKLLLLDTPDDNKVFSITFKTTPENSTGVPHIMEHSVLCGSDRYPLKDPFIELLKGSLNTFLNAMTWPDKTSYPVASRNEKDFRNLMSVYMDAVLHPNIYKTDKILKQEGWHYELDSADGELRYNGVVYNEMRGAFSDPDSVLEHEMTKRLFPGTTYEVVSGGDPNEIPKLTYEEFLAFHKRYYHPSNSYIYLYGDMDFTERLTWLDEAYLSGYDAIDPQTDIVMTKPFSEVVKGECVYGVSSDDDSDNSVMLFAKAVDGQFDPVENVAFQVLSYALLNAPGAPIKQALLDAGIGDEIYGGYDTSYFKPVFSVIAKGAKEEDSERFSEIVCGTLQKAAAEGIRKKTLYAGIHNIEFSLREADFGRAPRGLVYCFGIMDTWLHREDAALIHLRYNETFRKIKELVETDYFEKLLKKALIENQHGVMLHMRGEKGLAEKNDRAIREKLAAYKASLSKDEIETLIRETKELKAYQDQPETEEALRSIPMLSLSDIRKAPLLTDTAEKTIGKTRAIIHRLPTNGIGYLTLRFPLTGVPLADFPYVGLLRILYTMMDTESHTYNELSDEISLSTGGLGGSTFICDRLDGTTGDEFQVSARYLYEAAGETVSLIEEIFGHTVFTDEARLRDVLSQTRSAMANDLVASGNATASRRALSYTKLTAYEDDAVSGVEFYRFLDRILKNFDTCKENLAKKLKEIERKIFTDGVIVSYTGSEESFEALAPVLGAYLSRLPGKESEKADRSFAPEKKNEYLRTPSMVQYTAMCGNIRDHGFETSGAYDVLRTIMSYEYLWQNIRVKGGAYGCGMSMSLSGNLTFSSYRDPNLFETVEVYRGVPEYVRNLSISDRDMVKYILGTFSNVDMPMQPSQEGETETNRILQGITYEVREKRRNEMLGCTPEKLRALADAIESALRENTVVSVGSETKTPEKGLFATITNLQGESE